MKDKVVAALKKYSMIKPNDTVTIALSGGADSVSLLHVLNTLSACFPFELSAAHLNHCLRDSESDRDENFVRDICNRWNIPLTVESVDVRELSEKLGESIELTARRVRYDFLYRVSKGKTATAHTASDSLETIIFNIVRGTGLKGLAGIPPVRDNIIRPLIFCSRSDIENYCNENNIPFVNDSTNFIDEYTRNKIRIHVIPKLAEINPSLISSTVRMCESLRSDKEYFDEITKLEIAKCLDGKALNIKLLNNLHSSIMVRVISEFYKSHFGEAPDYYHLKEIENIVTVSKGKTGLKEGYYAQVRGDKLLILNNDEIKDIKFKKEIKGRVIELPIGKIIIDVITKDQYNKIIKVNNMFKNNAVDYDKITGKSTVRSRIEGDLFRASGRGVTKSLKKLFNESKIPVYDRPFIPIISDEKDIVWIFGFGSSERVSVDNDTKTVVIINFVKNNL